MLTRLKICGITTKEDALMCVENGVNVLGFNFYPESPRYIEPIKAREIIQQLPFFVSSVGILVKPTLDAVKNTIQISGVNTVQIYQPVDFHDFREIEVPTIVAFRICREQSMENFNYRGANMILIDSFSRETFGGTGKTFNWELIPSSIPREKLVLAGGITPYNVVSALEKVRPAMIDVASGAEKSPGVKDLKKVKELVYLIQQFNLKKLKMGN